MRNILKRIIEVLAKIRFKRSNYFIIGVTGNVGKSSTKEAIIAALKNSKRVRGSNGNLNNEFGLPLSILGGNWSEKYYSQGPSLIFWLSVIITETIKCILLYKDKTQILVLEYGADAPGDIQKLAKKYTPNIGIVTAVGDVPVHLEFFNSADHLAEEKMELIKYTLKRGGVGITNYDDQRLLKLSYAYDGIKYFGSSTDANVSFSDYKEEYDGDLLIGSSMRINNQLIRLNNIGESQGYVISCAVLVASELGVDLVSAIKSIEQNYKGLKGRLSILKGINDSVILDDTYNSSPLAVKNALNTLKNVRGNMKIAILGDMLELGELSKSAHIEIGKVASSFVDILICVGERSKDTFSEAINTMPKDRVLWFKDSNQLLGNISSLINPGDVVLLKGSQGVRMERVVADLLNKDINPKEVLVRQSEKWLNT